MSLFNPREPAVFPNVAKVINGYLWDSFKAIDDLPLPPYDSAKPNETQGRLGRKYKQPPFVHLADAGGSTLPWGDAPYFVYARLNDRPQGPAYWEKHDIIHYALRAKAEETAEWQAAFHGLLDQQDDAAKRINHWNGRQIKRNSDGTPVLVDGKVVSTTVPVYFHSLRVYQVDATDKWSESSANSFHVTEMMVRAKYHIYDSQWPDFEQYVIPNDLVQKPTGEIEDDTIEDYIQSPTNETP